jgi:hypothetical protein
MKIQCPKCTQVLQVPELKPGQTIRCPKCGQSLAIPAPAAAPAPLPPPRAIAAAPVPLPPPPVVKQAKPPVEEEVIELEEEKPSEEVIELEEEKPPEEVIELEEETPVDADASGLGPLVKEYKPRRWWIGLAIFTALFLLNVPFTILAFWINDKTKPWIGAAMIPNVVFLLGVIIISPFAAAGMKRRVRLHQRGLINFGVFSSAEVKWTEITGVYLVKGGIFQATDILLDLEGRDQVTLPSIILAIEELADRIIAATEPSIRPRIEKALDRGETVAFGQNISVTPKGLEFRPDGKKDGKVLKLRWKAIEGFFLGRVVTNPGSGGLAAAASIETQFRVTSADQPVWTCPTANVANFAIFIELLEKRFRVKIERS